MLGNFLSTTFYDLKVTFGYIGESPENFMSKYEYFENKHCIFWSKHGRQFMFQILLIGFLQIKTNQGKIEKNIKSLNETTSSA